MNKEIHSKQFMRILKDMTAFGIDWSIFWEVALEQTNSVSEAWALLDESVTHGEAISINSALRKAGSPYRLKGV